jgi:hypothetical protein
MPTRIVCVIINFPIFIALFDIGFGIPNSILLVLEQTKETLAFIPNLIPDAIYLIHQNSPT